MAAVNVSDARRAAAPPAADGADAAPGAPHKGAAAPQQGLWLRWEALVYDVALPKAVTPSGGAPAAGGSSGQSGSTKRVLHGLSGQVLPGQLLAIMGPSGSGKTSLMKILAGRRPPTAGTLLVNGAPAHVPTYRRASGFVAQNTVFLDTLTVRETIVTTALLRLDRSVSRADKLARAEAVIDEVDMRKCAHSRIGNDLVGGISGGERRRLSIGVEVVHRPRLLLLDEPTSGLDATSAQMVGDTLRRMSAACGTSSCCTIHQPRASLLGAFDALLLLAEGRTAYYGPVALAAPTTGPPAAGVLPYFAAAGHACGALENPGDWLLDLLYDAGGGEEAAGDDAEAGASAVEARQARAAAFAAAYAASPLAKTAMALPEAPPQPLPHATADGAFPTSWWTQFCVLWRRTMTYKFREPAAVMTQASTAVVLPLLVGGIYTGMDLSQTAITDRLAGISFIVLMQAFMCIDQILLFPKERSVYLRDHATGLHSTSSFFCARTLAELPFILGFGAICATIIYWLFGFQRTAAKFFTFVAVLCAVTEAGAALLTSIGALSPNMEVGNLLATLLIVILALLDGFYRNLAAIPPWCRWVSKLSFMGYGVQAAAANEFRGLAFSCSAEEAVVGCITTGDAYLQRLSMQDVNIWANVGYMIAFSVGSRFIAYCALRFMYTGQSFRERLAQP